MSDYTIEYEPIHPGSKEPYGLLFEFTPERGTKGGLAATMNDETLVLNVDINTKKGRTDFITEACDLHGGAFTLDPIDFRRALSDLAVHVDEEYKVHAAKAEEESDLADEDEEEDVDEEAVEALVSQPGVLERYVEAMAKIFDVYGDRAQMKVVALGALSAQLKPLSSGLPLGTNVMLIGEAGRGKNFVSDAVAAGLPRQFVYEFESASAKSFFYNADANPDRFRHTWVYPNEAEATDMLVETLRPLLSKAKATHNTVDTNAEGSNAFRELTIEGPLTVTIPTVRNKLDGQLQSRMLVIELEEFDDRVPKHSAKVSESLLLNRASEDHEGELKLWRAALRMLTETRRVGTTYQHDKFHLNTNKISHGARLWRNFLSLMLTHAWLEQKNRKTVELENGERAVAVASADYRAAYEVFSEACKRSVVELSETHRKILSATYALQNDEKRGKLRNAGFSYRKIGEKASISYETVRKQKAFLVQSVGLLREHEEGGLALVKDVEPSWWEDHEILEGFPKPDQVATWWDEEKKAGEAGNAVDTVDTVNPEDEKPIGTRETPDDGGVDSGVDVSTETSTVEVDADNRDIPIDKLNSNGRAKVSRVSTRLRGKGEKSVYRHSEDD